MLLKLFSLLKDDGILFIHTPNAKIQIFKAKIKKLFFGLKRGGHYLEARDHLNLYSADALKKVLADCGFNKIEVIHLPPIQSVTGSKSKFKIFFKNLWFYSAKFLGAATSNKINLDNLFIVASK